MPTYNNPGVTVLAWPGPETRADVTVIGGGGHTGEDGRSGKPGVGGAPGKDSFLHVGSRTIRASGGGGGGGGGGGAAGREGMSGSSTTDVLTELNVGDNITITVAEGGSVIVTPT